MTKENDRLFPDMVQSVTLTFSDGSKATFSGPAVLFEGQTKSVADISFGEPKELPSGCSWGEVK